MAFKNNPESFFNQQYGNSTWRDCSTVLHRLRCKKENSFNYLLPVEVDDAIENFYRDTPIFACKFAPLKGSEHLIALANEDGKLAIHNTKDESRYGIQAHNNAIFDLSWKFNELKLVTASGDHTLKLHDMGNGGIQSEMTFYGHSRSVKTVAFRKDDPDVFASGGRDGNIILWDSRVWDDEYMLIGNPERSIMGTHCSKLTALSTRPATPGKYTRRRAQIQHLSVKSVTGLIFQDGNTLISCGAGDGVIKVWDLRKNYDISKREANPKYVLPYAGDTSRNGFSCLQLDENAVKLYANCLDNTIYCYNISTYNPKPVMKYVGHQNSTFYVKSSLCKDGNYLLSGSSDECAYIWNVNHAQPLYKLTGHSAEVTCVAWCYRDHTLITCSDDMTHKVWTIKDDGEDNWAGVDDTTSEVISLKKPSGSGLKRAPLASRLTAAGTPKKVAVSCRSCDAPVEGSLCENCQRRLKRGRWPDEMCRQFSRDLGPKRLFGGLLRERAEAAGETGEPPAKVRRVTGSPGKPTTPDPVTSSPTVDLPNYVVDGTAPHLTYSPPPKRRRPDDWLTRLRVERDLRQQMLERTAGPSSPKSPRPDPSPRPEEQRRPRVGGVPPARSSLLRFFKVSNGKCEVGACPGKPHNCNVMISGTQVNH